MRVREQNRVHTPDVESQRLRPQIRRRVHQHAHTVIHLEEDRRPAADVARIGGRAHLAIAADHRDAVRGPRAEKHHSHKPMMLTLIDNRHHDEGHHGAATPIAIADDARVDTRARRAATAFARLVRVMATLRSPDGCPWDREQTHASLRPICSKRPTKPSRRSIAGDLGVAARPSSATSCSNASFTRRSRPRTAASTSRTPSTRSRQKLIRRHPHVFTPAGRPLAAPTRRKSRIRTATAVKEQWERIKAREQASAGTTRRVLKGVPTSLPALQRAHEIGRRVAAVGFDWARAADVVDKIDEEVRELRAAIAEGAAARSGGDRRPAVFARQPRPEARHRARIVAPRGQRQVHAPIRRARRVVRATRSIRPRRAVGGDGSRVGGGQGEAQRLTAQRHKAAAAAYSCFSEAVTMGSGGLVLSSHVRPLRVSARPRCVPSVSTMMAASRSVRKISESMRSRRESTSGAG